MIRKVALVLVTWMFGASLMAQSFSGTYTGKTEDGNCTIKLEQSGDKVTGTYTVETTSLDISATVSSGKARGFVSLQGTALFFVELSLDGSSLAAAVSELDDNGKADPTTTQKYVFKREGQASGSTTTPATFLDADGLKTVASNVKANFKRDKGSKVLSDGSPPLTLEAVAAFAELLKLCFGAEMTEAEFGITSKHFVKYYDAGDAQTKEMLAGGWQQILKGIQTASPAEREKGIGEVRTVLQSRFEAGAKVGMPWAVAMKNAIDMRATKVASIKGSVPDFAKKSQLRTEMTAADLEASLEMLYFMWVASGRDPNLVTADATIMVRNAIIQNFQTFPQEVKYIFANAQQVYSYLRAEWAQASPQQRAAMAQGFGQGLDFLGLTVPSAGGDTIHAGGAWSDMNGKSHGQWAAEMVQGLAGSSYHNAWSGS